MLKFNIVYMVIVSGHINDMEDTMIYCGTAFEYAFLFNKSFEEFIALSVLEKDMKRIYFIYYCIAFIVVTKKENSFEL